MKAIEQLLHRYEQTRRRKRIHRAFLTAVDSLAIVSFARMPRHRRLALAAAEALFVDRTHRRLAQRHR